VGFNTGGEDEVTICVEGMGTWWKLFEGGGGDPVTSRQINFCFVICLENDCKVKIEDV
jgi:hypothetical protein